MNLVTNIPACEQAGIISKETKKIQREPHVAFVHAAVPNPYNPLHVYRGCPCTTESWKKMNE
jgi:hypothetical protein